MQNSSLDWMSRIVHIKEDSEPHRTFCGLAARRAPFFALPQAVFVPSGTGKEIPYCKNCKRTRAYTMLVLEHGR
jgi:hypothetical protein